MAWKDNMKIGRRSFGRSKKKWKYSFFKKFNWLFAQIESKKKMEMYLKSYYIQ